MRKVIRFLSEFDQQVRTVHIMLGVDGSPLFDQNKKVRLSRSFFLAHMFKLARINLLFEREKPEINFE